MRTYGTGNRNLNVLIVVLLVVALTWALVRGAMLMLGTWRWVE
jgi:hypothetical protein